MARSSLVLAIFALCLMVPGIAQAEIIIETTYADVTNDWLASLNQGQIGQADQGYNGWSYGYYNVAGDPSTFVSSGMVWTSGDRWWVQGEFAPHAPEITSSGGHPGWFGDLWNKWAVRRWVAPVDIETLVVTGVTQRHQPGGDGGDGSAARFFHNGLELVDQAIVLPMGVSDPISFYFQLVGVQAGDVIDFAVDPLTSPNHDYMTLRATLSSFEAIPEPMTLTMVALGGMAVLGIRRRRSN